MSSTPPVSKCCICGNKGSARQTESINSARSAMRRKKRGLDDRVFYCARDATSGAPSPNARFCAAVYLLRFAPERFFPCLPPCRRLRGARAEAAVLAEGARLLVEKTKRGNLTLALGVLSLGIPEEALP